MNKYELILHSDGDIEIIEYNFNNDIRFLYHKTFNPGEELKDNLLNAYMEWFKLRLGD